MVKFIFCWFIFAIFSTIFVKSDRNCSDQDATKSYCSDNELCENGYCKCLPGYVKLNDECVKNSSDPAPRIQPSKGQATQDDTHSHLAIAVVVPVVLIIIIICSVILVKQYNLVSWVRSKMYQRETPYDEVMIGQDDDDPPLSGV